MTHLLKRWLPLGVAITMLAGLVYIVVQQDMRTAANDPQVQIAEDLALRFENGESSEFLNQATKTDIARSLAPFVSVYTSEGKMLVSTAVLDGETPAVPRGVLEYAKIHGKHTVTWRPRPGVRIAIVVEPYEGAHSGYVVVGRSLREVEKREEQLTLQIVLGLFTTLAVTLFLQKFLKG